jgi:hypothetical protein
MQIKANWKGKQCDLIGLIRGEAGLVPLDSNAYPPRFSLDYHVRFNILCHLGRSCGVAWVPRDCQHFVDGVSLRNSAVMCYVGQRLRGCS